MTSSQAKALAGDVAQVNADPYTTSEVASLLPAQGRIASSGEDAAAASAVGGIRGSVAGSTLRTEDKVVLAAATNYELSQRLPAGDPGAETLVGRNVQLGGAAIQQAVAACAARTALPGDRAARERALALALANELDAQLNGVSADQELMLAAIRAHVDHATPTFGDLAQGEPAHSASATPDEQSAEIEEQVVDPIARADHAATTAKRRPQVPLYLAVAAGLAAFVFAAKSCMTTHADTASAAIVPTQPGAATAAPATPMVDTASTAGVTAIAPSSATAAGIPSAPPQPTLELGSGAPSAAAPVAGTPLAITRPRSSAGVMPTQPGRVQRGAGHAGDGQSGVTKSPFIIHPGGASR